MVELAAGFVGGLTFRAASTEPNLGANGRDPTNVNGNLD